jgi:hypothetical protein
MPYRLMLALFAVLWLPLARADYSFNAVDVPTDVAYPAIDSKVLWQRGLDQRCPDTLQ